MSLLKVKPFSIDQAETFLFANANIAGNIVSGNANLGNLAVANYFSGNGSMLSSIAGGNVSGQVANALVAGTVYSSSQPNITSVGALTALTVNGTTDLGSIANVKIAGGSSGYVLKTDGQGNLSWASATSGTGNANVGGSNTQIQYNNGTNLAGSANLTFDVTTKTLTVDYVVADGSGLSNLAGSNVTGTVANANYAAYAGESFSVAGANVTGTVANATYAASAGTANSVAGANVVGEVAYAATANSVAGANVSGQVANSLVAGTVYTAAQPNITSVGTLTSLVVGNATSNTIFSGNGAISTNGNITVGTGFYFLGDGSQLTGVAAATATKTANGTSNVNIPTADGNVTVSVGGTSDVVTVTGTGVNVSGYLNATGNIKSGNVDGGNLVSANYISGNGSLLTAITGANVTGQVGYAAVANSVAAANITGQVANSLVAGTVYTSAQPNITSVGTLTSLTVSGALSAGDTTIAGNLTVTGTTTSVNSTVTQIVDPIFELGGGANGAALTSDDGLERGLLMHLYEGGATVDAFMGWMNANAEFVLSSNASVSNNSVTVNELGKLRAGDAVFGNAVTANYFVGNGSQLTGISATTSAGLANGTSNISVPTSSGNILISVAGNANIVTVTGTGVNVAGYINATGNIVALNANLGNLVSANFFSGSGNLLSNIQGANVTGDVSGANHANVADTANAVAGANVSGQVGNALIAGTVYTAAQPNITSVGTLTSLTSTGIIDLTGASNVSLGSLANIHIDGGSANYFLKTDGSGNLSWSALPSTTLSVDTFTGDGSWTMKTLSTTPLNINYTIVAIGGIFQPRDAYDVTGAVITFDDPPPNGAIVEITTINGGTAGAAGYVYQSINSSATAVTGVRYIVDTSTAVTLTLPSSPTLGAEVGIIDGTGTASSHNITINPNGGKIEGSSSSLVLSTDRAALTLVYYNSTQGWIKTVK